MSKIDEAMDIMNNMDEKGLRNLFSECFDRILESMILFSGDSKRSMDDIMMLIYRVIAFDNKIVKEEYELILSILDRTDLKDHSYRAVKELIGRKGHPNNHLDSIRGYYNDVVRNCPDVEVDLLCMMLAVLSVDGGISRKERKKLDRILDE